MYRTQQHRRKKEGTYVHINYRVFKAAQTTPAAQALLFLTTFPSSYSTSLFIPHFLSPLYADLSLFPISDPHPSFLLTFIFLILFSRPFQCEKSSPPIIPSYASGFFFLIKWATKEDRGRRYLLEENPPERVRKD